MCKQCKKESWDFYELEGLSIDDLIEKIYENMYPVVSGGVKMYIHKVSKGNYVMERFMPIKGGGIAYRPQNKFIPSEYFSEVIITQNSCMIRKSNPPYDCVSVLSLKRQNPNV
jgi:hypothetical protein